MILDDLIEKNLRYILKQLNISKQDLAAKLHAENVDIKPFALNPLFIDSKKKAKPAPVQAIINALGLPLPIMAMQDADKCLDDLIRFFSYGKAIGSTEAATVNETEYLKKIKSLEQAKERAGEKCKKKIAALKTETKSVILELSKKMPRNNELAIPNDHLFVDGIIPKTRAAQFFSWCLTPPKKRTKKG